MQAEPDRAAIDARISYEYNKQGRSYTYDESNRPRNPVGRTGITNRGALGKWGANHAADPIVTRRNPTKPGRPLEVVVIRRRRAPFSLSVGLHGRPDTTRPHRIPYARPLIHNIFVVRVLSSWARCFEYAGGFSRCGTSRDEHAIARAYACALCKCAGILASGLFLEAWSTLESSYPRHCVVSLPRRAP